MATLVEDARKASAWIVSALASSGYKADFSLESLREIDRFFDEQSEAGQAFLAVCFWNSLALASSRWVHMSARSSSALMAASGARMMMIPKAS